MPTNAPTLPLRRHPRTPSPQALGEHLSCLPPAAGDMATAPTPAPNAGAETTLPHQPQHPRFPPPRPADTLTGCSNKTWFPTLELLCGPLLFRGMFPKGPPTTSWEILSIKIIYHGTHLQAGGTQDPRAQTHTHGREGTASPYGRRAISECRKADEPAAPVVTGPNESSPTGTQSTAERPGAGGRAALPGSPRRSLLTTNRSVSSWHPGRHPFSPQPK